MVHTNTQQLCQSRDSGAQNIYFFLLINYPIKECEKLNATLPIVRNADENSALAKKVPAGWTWLGIMKLLSSSEVCDIIVELEPGYSQTNTSENLISVDYTNFAHNQGHRVDELAVVIQSNGKWGDSNIQSTHNTLCIDQNNFNLGSKFAHQILTAVSP